MRVVALGVDLLFNMTKEKANPAGKYMQLYLAGFLKKNCTHRGVENLPFLVVCREQRADISR